MRTCFLAEGRGFSEKRLTIFRKQEPFSSVMNRERQKDGKSLPKAMAFTKTEREGQHAKFFIPGLDLDTKTKAGGPYTGHRGDCDGAPHRSLAAYLLRISK